MSASCSITGPYANMIASSPGRRVVPRPGKTVSGTSIRRGEGPMASRIATFSAASSTAQRRSARVSSALAGCTIATFGSAPSSEMSRRDWCDFPGPAGMRPA